MSAWSGTQTTEAAPAPGRTAIVIALIMAVSLAALDVSVVGTAMPTIVGSLGGLKLFSWVFSVFLLTSTVTVPVYGKLADLYGRKPIIIFGITVFLISSALCGLAQNMLTLIIFRALQGLGAGAVFPITMTIIGDVFSIEERARIQGFFSGVWGVAGVAGPTLGGIVTDTFSWRWVFLLNIPFGIAALALLWTYYHEHAVHRSHVLDYWGAMLLSGSVVSLLIGVLQASQAYGWLAGPTLGLFALSALLLALFIRQERRTPEPIMPLSLYRNRIIVVSSMALFVAGGINIGVSSYVPLFEQGVFGGTATMAGLVLAPMSFGWVTGATISGRLILKVGYYPAAMIGGACLFLGSAGLLLLSADNTILVAAATGILIGVGMGFSNNATIIAVQNAVEWGQRGIATASTQFFRTIGGSITVAIMGALLNSRMSERFAAIEGAPEAGRRADVLLRASTRESLQPAVLEAMQRALAASLHEVFFVVMALSAICLAVLCYFPRGQVSEFASVPSQPPRPAVAETPDS